MSCESHRFAERVCERLPRRLQELREAAGLSLYALAKRAGVSREMVARIEAGKSVPTLHLLAKLTWALEASLAELHGSLEEQ